MAKINKLDPSIYNLISAGEVVENPASVVKELVENSIDAGATEITISIDNGGIDQIRIIDNGIGMDKENIYLSYLPHATSKIAKATDLDTISTLGFRGEALASIAAVSHMTISSRELHSDIGYLVKVSSGVIEDEYEVGIPQGTVITIDNLFYNTPVRLKFLKKPKQEESLVTAKVDQLIFANCDVKFKYIVDGEVIYQTSGGLEDAVYSVYGTEIANGLIPFNYSYTDYKVYGFTGNRETVKHTKSYETVIVNGRPITNSTVILAVMQAYGTSLMKRTYPVCVINIVMPFDQVDVNVHPTKSDVRFQDSHKVFSAVYRAILTALDTQDKSVHLSDFDVKKPENLFINLDEKRTNVQNENNQKQTYVQSSFNIAYKTIPNLELNTSNNRNSDVVDVLKKTLNNNSSLETEKNTSNNSTNKNSNLQNQYSNSASLIFDELSKNSTLDDIENNITQSYVVVGQLFETFLIIQDGSKAYLIDQHACHEKFLYENLIKSIDNKEITTQPLFIPYVFDCNSNQYDYMTSLISDLNSLGFSIEEFGGLSFKVSEVPVMFVNIDLKSFFDDILSEKSLIGTLKTSDLVKERLAQSACKAAVKSGDKLSDSQVREIFKQMKDGIPMQCPHGRPCIFEFNHNDLDKLFKRLV